LTVSVNPWFHRRVVNETNNPAGSTQNESGYTSVPLIAPPDAHHRRAETVASIQLRLRVHGYTVPHDGKMGASTRAAVRDFQDRRALSIDGTINEATWAALRGAVDSSVKPSAVRKEKRTIVDPVAEGGASPPLDELARARTFPIDREPRKDWHGEGRQFGARRSGSHGGRAHAGCDLLAPRGTPVRAVDDGMVINVAPFYDGTSYIEVDHGAFVVRYGEVQPPSFVDAVAPVAAGEWVKRGQQIGRVGWLVQVKNSMLHFEMYKGTRSGSLSLATPNEYEGGAWLAGAVPFYRRADLIDPTPFIDSWSSTTFRSTQTVA
jgi:murein DD-endopeptidase MepM/ murein hydrolase activator NlpD